MLNEITGVAGFRCEDANGNDNGIVYEDITILANWRDRPSEILKQFQNEAEQLSRITGIVCAGEGNRNSIFTGEIKDYFVSKRGKFTCNHEGSKEWVLHDVYTVRIKDETPDETEARLAIEAVERHTGLVPLDCEGPVEFSGQFFDIDVLASPSQSDKPPEESIWEKPLHFINQSRENHWRACRDDYRFCILNNTFF